jgi:ankyrin repeat protein
MIVLSDCHILILVSTHTTHCIFATDMDPLSSKTSIITILRLAAKVLRNLDYVTYGPTDDTKRTIGANNLLCLLEDLWSRIEERCVNEPWSDAVQALIVEGGILDQLKKALTIPPKIKTMRGTLGMTNERLIWTLEKDGDDVIERNMKRLNTLIEIALFTAEEGRSIGKATDSDSQEYLVYAAERGNNGVAKLLLDNGAEVNGTYGEHSNALQVASFGGHVQLISMLLDKGADVNVQGGRYGDALQAAIIGGQEHAVKVLLHNGADIRLRNGDRLAAASSVGHVGILEALLESGAEVNVPSGLYGNALYAASSGGHEKIVRLLLDKGANVDAPYGNALQAASSIGHEGIVKALLGKGADVNAHCGVYRNALYSASSRNHEKVVELLLDKGADVNALDGSGRWKSQNNNTYGMARSISPGI